MLLIHSSSDLDIVAHSLQWDRDTHELAKGYELTLRVQPDDMHSVFDECGAGSWFGRLEWVTWNRDYGRAIRPEWADGGAELLRSRSGELWWRPDVDALRDAELRSRLRSQLLERLEYGYSLAWVELSTPEGDYCSSTLGGIDEVCPEIVAELVCECCEDWHSDYEAAGLQLVERILAEVGA